jgi:hypothetical protein
MIEVKVAKLGIDVNSKMPVIILKEKEGEKSLLYGSVYSRPKLLPLP